jgi:osmotically-inducible protein OsmY
MYRNETESHRERGNDRPRDEQGRFESEQEHHGEWGYNNQRGYDAANYSSRFGGGYGQGGMDYGREGRGWQGRDDTQYYNPNDRDYDRQYDRSRRDYGDLEAGYRGRQGRAAQGYEMGRAGTGTESSYRPERSYDRSYYGRTTNPSGSGNWGDERYGYDRSDDGRHFQGGAWGDQSYYQGGYSPGSSHQTESMFGMRETSRGDVGPRYDRGPNQHTTRGQFSGRGPKGYRRSDERIEEDVNEALSRDPQLDASEIEVKVSNGEVTLSGTVNDRQFKRMAEDIAERCSGVHDVRNEIRVQRGNGAGASEQNESHQQLKGKTATGAGSKGSETKTA